MSAGAGKERLIGKKPDEDKVFHFLDFLIMGFGEQNFCVSSSPCFVEFVPINKGETHVECGRKFGEVHGEKRAFESR